MASQGAYKSYGRSPRQVNVEENYGRGMYYTDTPQLEGYCKALINYDMKDKGEVLLPRSGYRNLHTVNLSAKAYPQKIHHIGQAAVNNTDTDEDTSNRYVFMGCDDGNAEYFDFKQGSTLLEQEFSPEFGSTSQSFSDVPHTTAGTSKYMVRQKERSVPQLLHNVPLTPEDTFTQTNYNAVYAMLNSVPIMPVKYTPVAASPQTVKLGFAKMLLKTNNIGEFTNTLEFIEPKVITPTTAVNYGYNMLSSTPYTFKDTKSASVGSKYMIMQGIVPYTDPQCTDLKFNAKVGEWVTFRLYADFPNNEVDTYKFRWEIRSLDTDDVTVYEDQAKTLNSYRYSSTAALNVGVTPNTPYIKLTIQPPYKTFGVTVTAYSTDDLTSPVQVITLGSYSMVADAAGSTYGITPRTYALHTATDMCTWRQRIVLWGVQGAPNMLFFSDVNDPTYFPYPNNAEIFEEAIIACVPYLGNLLVFTASQLFKMSLAGDGLTYKTDMVQDKLALTEFDKETITLVQNMLYFKNGNYFYMVVPRTSSAQPGAIQLAPISTPITYMLDHFETEVLDMVFKLYNPYDSTKFPRVAAGSAYSLRLQDYYNYLDNVSVRNVYKYELVTRDVVTHAVTAVILNLDLVLNYDTLARVWSMYTMQGNNVRLLPYRQTVTDATIYAQVRNITAGIRCDFVKPDSLSAADEFPILPTNVVQERLLRNFQFLDTGYRNQTFSHKKRYREIQFTVNRVSRESLQFGSQFMLDDQVRKDLYTSEVRHVTDPEAPDYGWIYVERVFDAPYVTGGASILDDVPPETPYLPGEKVTIDDTFMLQSSRWVLDASQLSPVTTAKVRLSVSGKGYAPRLLLISFNDTPYELLSHVWVFRTMNAR